LAYATSRGLVGKAGGGSRGGRGRPREELLFFKSGGFVLFYKRLEKGRFTMLRVEPSATEITLDAASLTLLLDRFDLRGVRGIPTWRPALANTA
jgi:transposase